MATIWGVYIIVDEEAIQEVSCKIVDMHVDNYTQEVAITSKWRITDVPRTKTLKKTKKLWMTIDKSLIASD